MSSPRRRDPLVLVALLGVACASSGHAPPDPSGSSPRTVVVTENGHAIETSDAGTGQRIRVAQPPGAALVALAQVYSDLNIPLGTVQSAAGQVGNLNLRVTSHSLAGRSLSTYLSCGQSMTGNRVDEGQVTVSILSTVVAIGDSASLVTTQLDGRMRPWGQSTDAVQCQTTGVLERRVNVRVSTILARTP